MTTKLISIGGVSRSLSDWLQHYGLLRVTYRKRREAGWSVEKALTTPVKKRSLPPLKKRLLGGEPMSGRVGVYAVQCHATGRFYLGSTTDLGARFQVWAQKLRRRARGASAHLPPIMKSDLATHGIGAFEFRVLARRDTEAEARRLETALLERTRERGGGGRLYNLFSDDRHSRTSLLVVDGVAKPLTEWLQEAGVSRGVYWARMRRGWDKQRAATTPVRERPTDAPTIAQQARERDLLPETVYNRIHRLGWSKEEALNTPVEHGPTATDH